jgi:hypothetical protein
MLHAERFVDYLVDKGGLADFVDEQLAGTEKPWGDEEWESVRQRVWHLSDKRWQPTIALLQGIYDRQKAEAA